MTELVTTLLLTPQGTVLLYLGVFLIAAIIFWVLSKTLHRIIGIGKGGLQLDRVSNLDIKVVKDQNGTNILMIRGIIGDEYEKFLLSKEELNTKINQEIKNVQQLALTRAIENLCLEFSDMYEESGENTVQKMGQILELYLNRDFSIILLSRLEDLRKSAMLLDKTENEINAEVQSITNDCIRTMKLKIKDYVLISDTKILQKLFDASTKKMRDTIDDAIKSFIKLSKDQQAKIVELTKTRTATINEKLESLIGEKKETISEPRKG